MPPLPEEQIVAKKYLKWDVIVEADTRNGARAISISLTDISGHKGRIMLSSPIPRGRGTGVKNFCMRLKSCFLTMGLSGVLY